MAERAYVPEPVDWSFTYRVRDTRIAFAHQQKYGRMTAERYGAMFIVRSPVNYHAEAFAAVLLASLDFDPPTIRMTDGGAR